MKIADIASKDVKNHGGGERPPCIELTLDTLPEVQKPGLVENSQTGVSTICYQIYSLKNICIAENTDVILASSAARQFKAGRSVNVIDVIFKGIVGKLTCYQGQQRVPVIIDALLTIASACVSSTFLEIVEGLAINTTK